MFKNIDWGYILIALIAVVTLFFIYQEAVQKKVRIGLNPNANTSHRHGLAWIENPNGSGIVKYSFIVDAPGHLIDPTPYVIRDMFNQLIKMNITPHFLEIQVGDYVRTYKFGERQPIMVEPRVVA